MGHTGRSSSPPPFPPLSKRGDNEGMHGIQIKAKRGKKGEKNHEARQITYLVGDGVGETVPAAPVAAAHGHDGHLGDDDGTADSGSHLCNHSSTIWCRGFVFFVVSRDGQEGGGGRKGCREPESNI